MDSFKFTNGPDDLKAELRHYSKPDDQGRSSYIAFSGKGPRGGYVYGPSSIDERYMDQLDDMIADAKGWPYRCKGCGRAEDDCCSDPCEAVLADREA